MEIQEIRNTLPNAQCIQSKVCSLQQRQEILHSKDSQVWPLAAVCSFHNPPESITAVPGISGYTILLAPIYNLIIHELAQHLSELANTVCLHEGLWQQIPESATHSVKDFLQSAVSLIMCCGICLKAVLHSPYSALSCFCKSCSCPFGFIFYTLRNCSFASLTHKVSAGLFSITLDAFLCILTPLCPSGEVDIGSVHTIDLNFLKIICNRA